MIKWIISGMILLIITYIVIRVVSNWQDDNGGGEGGFIGSIRATIDKCCGSLRGE